MSIFFEKESKFTGLNLLIYQIASNPTPESSGKDGNNYHNIAPKPTIESTRNDGNDHNTAPKLATLKGTHEEGFISKLVGTLKGMISQAVFEVKQRSQAVITEQAANNGVIRAMPISYHVPEDYDSNVLSMNEKKGPKSMMVGEIQTSFKILEGCALCGSELNKLPVHPHLEEHITLGVGFKFLQRLEGWKLQCMQRADGKLDKYFYHIKSNEAFRSNNEVVHFIIYGICPRHLKKATKASNENLSGSNWDGRLPKMSSTSLCSPSNSRGISTEAEEKAAKEFSAYNRMFNNNSVNENSSQSFSKRKRTEDSSSPATSRREEKCICPSSDDLVTSPPVDAIANVDVEVQDRMASASKPDQLVNKPKPSNNPYQYELVTSPANLIYRRFGAEDFM